MSTIPAESGQDLPQRILALLRASDRPLSAGEIADALGGDGGAATDRRSVNRCLYSTALSPFVVQDSRYRWACRSGSRAPNGGRAGTASPVVRPLPDAWGQFARLVPYYLDCILEDESHGVRQFLTDEGRKFVTLPLDAEWCLSGSAEVRVSLGGLDGAFAQGLRMAGPAATMVYGYPLYVDWIDRARSGWSGGFAVPVFLLPVDHHLDGPDLWLRLQMEWPRLNPQFAEIACRTPEEKRHFLATLGLMQEEGEPPEEGLADFARRMAQQWEFAEFAESIDPEHLASQPPIATLSGKGVYNQAIVAVSERSPYTRGLERELPKLSQASEGQLSRSALRLLFPPTNAAATPPSASSTGQPLAEIVPLNDEQRNAVRSAFENDFTVVTGPPGTGKSQVVLTVLANAYLRGQRVLFTSRNNKAVDVVELRLNALSGIPLLIRTGRRSGERDLRSELLRFLSQLLSSATTDEDRLLEAEARRAVERIQAARDELWTKAEAVRCARNQVDQLDQVLDRTRTSVSTDTWQQLWAAEDPPSEWDPGAAVRILDEHMRPPGGVLRRLRLLLRRGRDFATIEALVDVLAEHQDLLGVPPDQLSPASLGAFRAYFEETARRLEVWRAIAGYREAYAKLQQHPSVESLAGELASTEEDLWEWGARFIAAKARLLPARLADASLRRAVGEYQATIERLAGDQMGGAAYARLMREQERLFSRVSEVLPVWCVTNLSASGSLPFESGIFDLAIIDEASQCDIPSALPILHRARRAMIIGDPHQLRHVATLDRLRDQQLQAKHGLTGAADQPYTFQHSLYDLAATCAGESKVVDLREHFRSHADIIGFSNRPDKWYQGRLRVCTDYRRLLSVPGELPGVRWTDARGNARRPTGGGAVNQEEVEAVVEELRSLLCDRGFRGSVGVVTPFRAQANRIRDRVADRVSADTIERAALIVDTAHGFQGDERDVILFSPCVSPDLPRGPKWFLAATDNLFNVAITRARTLLHVIGDMAACASCGIPHIADFANHVARLQQGEPAPMASGGPAPEVGPWEAPLCETLRRAGLNPMPQYREHQYVLDMAIKEADLWLDIEVDGEYYHREWDGTRCRQDLIRDLRLTALGWTVKRFWVYQVRDEMEACVQEVARLVQTARRAEAATQPRRCRPAASSSAGEARLQDRVDGLNRRSSP